MLVLWEVNSISVKSLGDTLYLDSGTLTPMLKKMEKDGCIERKRSSDDERVVIVSLTQKGKSLEEKAKEIPNKVMNDMEIDKKDAIDLHRILYKILNTL